MKNSGEVLSIEVKSNTDDSNSGLGEFCKRFKNAKAFIVGEGGMKAEDFLQMNPGTLF